MPIVLWKLASEFDSGFGSYRIIGAAYVHDEMDGEPFRYDLAQKEFASCESSGHICQVGGFLIFMASDPTSDLDQGPEKENQDLER